MSAARYGRMVGGGLLRLILLAALVVGSGVALGFAAGVPLGHVKFADSQAIRLDQSRLAGTFDPQVALVEQSDLPIGWLPGDPALGAFGILGNQFCGETVKLPTALSDTEVAVFSNEADGSTLIVQALRVEQWQTAREYVRKVDTAISSCDKFFQNDLDGKRQQVDIADGHGDPPITDYVSRTYISRSGKSVQTWSLMVVGDVLVGVRYLGPTGPQHSLMADTEKSILIRTAPKTFAPSGADAEFDAGDEPDTPPSDTSIVEGGAADESPGATGGPGVTAPDGEAPTTTGG